MVDLVPLVRDMLHRISATVTGLDGVDTKERVTAFRSVVEALHFASTVEVSIRDVDEVLAEGRTAREEFVRDFYEPSLERRRALLRRSLAGEDVELPVDLLTLLLSHGLADEDWALPEAVLYVIAAVSTTTHALPHVVKHLSGWIVEDGSRRSLTEDRQFLRAAIAESLRLHTPNPFLVRKVAQAVTLECTGRAFDEGDVLVLHFGVANRDPAPSAPTPSRSSRNVRSDAESRGGATRSAAVLTPASADHS